MAAHSETLAEKPNDVRKPRSRAWRWDPEGRRARILHAAAHEFGRKGYHATRVEDIAKAADVAEGTVYHWFRTKRGLLIAVGDRYGQRLAEAAFGGIGASPQPSDVESVVQSVFAFVRETEQPLAAFILSNQTDEGAPAQAASRAQMLEAIQSVLDLWVRSGEAPAMNTQIAAKVQYGLVEAALRTCFLEEGGADEAAYQTEVTRALRASLHKR